FLGSNTFLNAQRQHQLAETGFRRIETALKIVAYAMVDESHQSRSAPAVDVEHPEAEAPVFQTGAHHLSHKAFKTENCKGAVLMLGLPAGLVQAYEIVDRSIELIQPVDAPEFA